MVFRTRDGVSPVPGAKRIARWGVIKRQPRHPTYLLQLTFGALRLSAVIKADLSSARRKKGKDSARFLTSPAFQRRRWEPRLRSRRVGGFCACTKRVLPSLRSDRELQNLASYELRNF